jgi:DNA-binding LacI/PurR family transcriptional regulator
MGGGSRLVDLARERRLPFMALDFAGDASVPGLWVDDAAGARMAARHLLDLGHRDFAVLALPAHDRATGPVTEAWLRDSTYPSPRERIRGYFETLAGAGVDTARVPIYETDNDEETTRSGMEFLFAEGRRPRAILAMSDRMALAAVEWLAEQGIAVPGEVSVIGFDGVPEAARSLPPLTTIAQPMLEMGRAAALAILTPAREAGQTELPLSLVVRGTTAPPRA